MKPKQPFTVNNIVEATDKHFYYIESGKLNLPNTFSPDDLEFFYKYFVINLLKLSILNLKSSMS